MKSDTNLGNEKRILDYIKNYKEEDYEQIFENDKTFETLEALSDIRKNIINWYPFKSDSTILEIDAGLGEITGELCKKARKVISIATSDEKAEAIRKRYEDKINLEVIVQDIENIKLNQQFDYITLIGTIDKIKNKKIVNNLIKNSKNLLNKDGIILLAMDNEFGMNNFTSIDKLQAQKEKNISIKDILTILEKNNIRNIKNYYPLPNYKFTNVIFTDSYLPDKESICRNIILVPEDKYTTIDQNLAYKKIINKDKNLFKAFSNSVFMEIFNEEYVENNIRFISFSNIRKPEYRIKTVIKDKLVYKEAVNKKSEEHIKNIIRNIEILNELGINTVDSFEEKQVISEYQENVNTLDKILIQKYENSQEEFINMINKFKQNLLEKLVKISSENNVFDKYRIDYEKEDIENLNFVKYGLWDLIFQNCFYKNEEFYFYDQEWLEDNMPIEYIIYRAIKYFTQIAADKKVLYEKLEINEIQIELFEKLDYKIQEKVRDKIIWETHIKQNNVLDEINTLQTDKEKILEDCRNLLLEKDSKIKVLEEKNNSINMELKQKSEKIDIMVNSKSWKITRPLRNIVKKLKVGDKNE